MQTLTRPFSNASKSLYHPRKASPPRGCQAFLQALTAIQYGSLALRTPDGEWFRYAGSNPGPDARMDLNEWIGLSYGIAKGETGFADGYIEKWWDTDDLTALLTFALLNASALERFFHGNPLHLLRTYLGALLQFNTPRASRRNAAAHYDLGNDFYALWLDKGMTYSCGLFENDAGRSLEQAQSAKYARILSKLNAEPGSHVLEIGCGWGGFAEAAARQGLRVTAITLSVEQAEYARERMRRQGLDSSVNVELQDYRAVEGWFDHIVSIGMFEHVGEHHWQAFFDTVRQRLAPQGIAMIQTITLDDEIFEKLRHVTGFIEERIFPGGLAPSRRRFRAGAERAGLECREMFGFGQDYARTLTHWLSRFEARLPEIKALGYDERFIRLWRFYLASCIASFLSCRSSVMQAELSHKTA